MSTPRFRPLLRVGKALLWIALALVILGQLAGPSRLRAARNELLSALQEQRGSRVIAMIHREESVSLLGVPVSSSIDIEDSEAILRAIRLTPPDQPIDIILHTPGGLVLAAEQIAHAVVRHPGPVTDFVPHYAMSGGTLIALAADSIVMDPNAVLGPVDPQIGDTPAASLAMLGELKRPSAIADGFNGFVVHLANHDVTLSAVSRAPLAKLQVYKRRMGWTLPWASSFGSDFNSDFNVWFTEKQQREGGIEYNYRREAAWQGREISESGGEGAVLLAAMSGTDAARYTRERPGMSAFALEDGIVYHAYSTYARGLDGLWGMYQWLDRAPKGRNETGVWWRRRDEYDKR